MNLAKNFVSALNTMLGFEVLNENETIDEATARLEGMQPIDSAVVVKVNEIESKMGSIDSLSTKVDGVIKSQSADNDALLSLMNELKSEIAEIKSAMTPARIVSNTDTTITKSTGHEISVISLGKGRFSKN